MRVLVHHPSRAVRRRMRETLTQVGADVVAVATNPDEALALIRMHHPDVAVVHERQVAREATHDPDLLSTTVVLITALDLRAVTGALEDGAHDVIDDPPGDPELIARVQAAARVATLREQLLTREQRLEGLAFGDELTGLFNRRYLQRRLSAQQHAAARHGGPLAIAMIDVDHFKAINDRHGHAIGDTVLREIAQHLRQAIRDEDVIGRWGGEEFLAILPDLEPGGVGAAAERLRQTVRAHPLTELDIHATVSIGAIEGSADISGDELIRRADQALYEAKRSGRDRVVVAPAAHALAR